MKFAFIALVGSRVVDIAQDRIFEGTKPTNMI